MVSPALPSAAAPPEAPGSGSDGATIRLDKWLWQARFFKSRSLAAQAVGKGVRVNGTLVTKPAASLRPGDVITFVQARQARVVRMLATGTRRGPASEAQALYDDLSPPADAAASSDPASPRAVAGGRPTGRARRMLDAQIKTAREGSDGLG
ncbi:MAG: RNA-binding S4 domain-containing protein [Pararhodobacter sp.]